MEADFEDREATLHVTNLDVEDYVTLDNALADGPSKPATVSFEVNWRGGGKPIQIGDGVNFRATVIEDSAIIRWSAHEEGFRFRSTATTKQEFSEIGIEHNGIFR